MLSRTLGTAWRHFGRFGAYGLVYGVLAGAFAGALYQLVLISMPYLLMEVGLIAPSRLYDNFVENLVRRGGLVAILGATGGAYYGAILGVLIGLLVGVVLYRRTTWPIPATSAIRVTVFAVLALGWLANVAISPVNGWQLLAMIELGLAMLLAGWWLARRFVRLARPGLVPAAN